MMTVEELNIIQNEIDENYKAEMKYQLDIDLRQYVVDWGQQISDALGMAAYSAVNGKWDDIKKDIQRSRISRSQFISLLDEMKRCRLISIRQYDWYCTTF